MSRRGGPSPSVLCVTVGGCLLRAAVALVLDRGSSDSDAESGELNCTSILGRTLEGGRDPSLRIVVSLATTGTTERLQYVERTLQSLTNQTLPVDRIILTFPDIFKRFNTPIVIPPEVQEWTKRIPILTVQQMKDYGPGSKLLGGLKLEHDGETILVIVDDDVRYDHRVVETLVCQLVHEKTYRHRDIAPAFACEKSCTKVPGSRFHKIPGTCHGYGRGVAGLAYRVRYFDGRVWDVTDPSTPESCFINDDVWIGGSMLRASGVRPYLITPEAGWRSVLEHGSCEVHGTEGCGHTSNSSTVENNRQDRAKHMNSKHRCEKYFNELCGDAEPRPP